MSLVPTSPIPTDGAIEDAPHGLSSTAFLLKSLNDSTPTIVSNDHSSINNEHQTLQPSPSKEYMTLTPVKLKSLDSPLKNNQSTQKTHIHFSQSPLRIISPTTKMYKDKFDTISRELEKLLEDLSVIYKKIGYSPSGTKTNERLIFTTLSNQIKEFYTKAEEEMKNLTLNNEIEQQVLNAMLNKLNDPKGLNIIPDLYTRNTILLPQNRTVPDSPKKPLSLLEIQKSLNDAKQYVVKAYLPELINFLNANIELQKNYKMIDEILKDLDDNEQNTLKSLPSLELSEKLANLFCPADDKYVNLQEKEIYNIFDKIKDNRKILLFSDNLCSIDEKIVSDINKITNIYKQEYSFRANNLIKNIKKIKDILNELDIDIHSEFSPSMNDIFHNYLNLNENNKNSLPVTTSALTTVATELQRIETIKNERTKQKDELLNQCQLLWNKFNVPRSHIDSVLTENKGLSMHVIQNLNNELKNLEILKKKMIKQLISDSRNKINEYWVTLQIAEDERKEFIENYERMNNNSNSILDDEKLLDYCESETKRLEEKLAIYTPVLKLINDLQNLIKDKDFLEKSSKDSARLLSRNSHKILLKEEKARKRITRHFPKVICELKEKLASAQDLFQKPFILNGKKLCDLIEEEETEFRNKYPRSVLSMKMNKRNTNSLSKKNSYNDVEGLTSPLKNNQNKSEQTRRRVKDSKYRIHKPKTPNNKLQQKINRKLNATDNNILKTMNGTKGNCNSDDSKQDNSNNENPNSKYSVEYIIKSPHSTIKTNTYSNNVESKGTKSKLLSPTAINAHKQKLTNKSLFSFNQLKRKPAILDRQPCLLRSNTVDSSSFRDYYKENSPMDSKYNNNNNNNNKYTRPLHGIRPTRLFPLDSNKLNKLHKSNIPVLYESKSVLTRTQSHKIKQVSNLRRQSEKTLPSSSQKYSQELKQRSLSFPIKKQESTVLASPYRESVNSIYQLSMSPEGKFQLNIRQKDKEDKGESNFDDIIRPYTNINNDIFDDTSILDDDETDSNFIEWKREQLMKLDNLKQKQQEQRIFSDNISTS